MLPPGRYLVEVSLLALLFVGAASALAGLVVEGAVVLPVVMAAAIVTILDTAVYALLRRGLMKDPAEFMTFWGLASVAKFFVLGAAVVFALVAGWESRRVFLLALAAAFAIFSVHQIIRLLPGARKSDPSVAVRAVNEGGLA